MLRITTISEKNSLIIEFPLRVRAISSTILGGGLRELTHTVFHRVGEDFNDPNPREYAIRLVRDLGLPIDTTAVFLTAVDVVNEYRVVEDKRFGVEVVGTIGFKPLACIGEIQGRIPSTINILVYTSKSLSVNALVDLVMTASSAKTLALVDLALSCRKPSLSRAYATATDAIIVASPIETGGEDYGGPATPIGSATAKLVYDLILSHGLAKLDINDRLENILGVNIEWIIDSSLKIYSNAPVPGVPVEKIRRLVEYNLVRLLRDPNVWSMLMASHCLDKYGLAGTIPGLTRSEYTMDSKRIVSDELLGIMLALYVNGWKALFSYYWVDRLKNELEEFKDKPMFIDDILASLIGSILSKVYDEYLGRE